MANYEDAFEGEDFTAEDLEEFLSPKFLWAVVLNGLKIQLTIAGACWSCGAIRAAARS